MRQDIIKKRDTVFVPDIFMNAKFTVTLFFVFLSGLVSCGQKDSVTNSVQIVRDTIQIFNRDSLILRDSILIISPSGTIPYQHTFAAYSNNANPSIDSTPYIDITVPSGKTLTIRNVNFLIAYTGSAPNYGVWLHSKKSLGGAPVDYYLYPSLFNDILFYVNNGDACRLYFLIYDNTNLVSDITITGYLSQ